MNRLATSLSPYLLQHKNNPVDWYPWGEEAFESAVCEDKPIFLSVGYAACHWCHVMEHESFEDASIAALLNEKFVSIKVDREERPDIDQVYMNAVQVMTGRGGWPMSVFLDHQRQPFFAGTYWPPKQKFGMPGFSQILESLSEAWVNRRDEVLSHSGQITAALQQLADGTEENSDSDTTGETPEDDLVLTACERLLEVLDPQWGGFGSAPKFPHATDLSLLLRMGQTTDNEAMVAAAELTLDRMAAGGIRDHIGGGFSRYSVDGQWLVPHFEKMLYDNALLAEVYVRAFQVTGHKRHAEVARETLDYVCRELIDSAGGFHCSEDADSEGVEGKYYVWNPEEVEQVLGTESARDFCTVYDISEKGNFEGKSIPNLPQSLSDWAEELSVDEGELSAVLAGQREQLRTARDNRVHPGRDDKVVTSWNALMIKSLSVAGAVLDQPAYLTVAETAAEFLLNQMTRDDGRLLHAFRGGKAHLDAFVDDYAYTIEAFVGLFEATGRARWIGRAIKLADCMIAHFEDRESGGFFYTADDAESLIARNKDWHDGSLVSGNASAANGLLKLSQLCERDDFRDIAHRTLIAGAAVMRTQAGACAALLTVVDDYHHGNQQLVLAVSGNEELMRIRPSLFAAYRPHAAISWVIGQTPDSGPVVALNRACTAVGGEPTLYRCENFSCEQPLRSDELENWLADDQSS
ncbi:thioredoxin domain-containing protein [Rhodopirellula sp.]|nr:thioredoxin domain-containing protein [Rubripirellula sp.]MDA7874796.1 thioredoxin domain-containing protein [Rhodopirellula sp.]MDB4624700.1 thioredoxin domain-containing protein [Rubripirellula sp.]